MRIEDAVPLMNLAITTSGAKLSTNLPASVSPSRLLQASTFLTAGDTQYSMSPSQAVQVGPTFTLSMYMLFAGHSRPHDDESARETTWKEVMHKSRLKLRRVPIHSLQHQDQRSNNQVPGPAGADYYTYQILLIEDLDDGRVHTFDDNDPQPQSYEGLATAGIREIIPIHQISKIFYADTGRILNISTEGETNNPVLLLKRDIHALPPRRMMEREEVEDFSHVQPEEESEDEEQAQLDAQLNEDNEPAKQGLNSFHPDSIPKEWRLPSGLDPEWIAFEVFNEDETSDTESDFDAEPSTAGPAVDPNLMAKLSIEEKSNSPPPSSSPSGNKQPFHSSATTTVSNPHFENIRTSLSLLETLLRLTSLQQFQQQSHLSISDELLNFFLEESSTTGAGGDEQHRQRLRYEARRRVGWDPYNESPVKHRGEDYQYGWEAGSSPYPYGGDPYSPSRRAQGFSLRSREATPETPIRKSSPNFRSSGLRDMAAVSSDSPLSQKGHLASKDGGPSPGTAE